MFPRSVKARRTILRLPIQLPPRTRGRRIGYIEACLFGNSGKGRRRLFDGRRCDDSGDRGGGRLTLRAWRGTILCAQRKGGRRGLRAGGTSPGGGSGGGHEAAPGADGGGRGSYRRLAGAGKVEPG